MKRQWLVLLIVVAVAIGSASVGFCETLYTPGFFASDKEALDVLQSLKGSFFSWSNYPKQTVEIDRSGVRIFSEYIGTKMVWNVWEMYYMTVPDIRSENANLVFKNVSSLLIGNHTTPNAAHPVCVSQDNTVSTTFCMKDEITARRFADAVATLAGVAGAKWVIDGGYTIPDSESWFRNKLNWKKETGAVIKMVKTGGPFDRAGIQAEDIVVTFAGQEVANGAALWKMQQDLIPRPEYEIKVPVTIFRRGAIQTKEIIFYNYSVKASEIRKLLDQPATPVQVIPEKPRLGATIRALTEEDVKALNLTSKAGVLVTGVDNNSVAQRMNLAVNDVILEVNGIAIKDITHLQEILTSPTPVSKLKVKRGDALLDLAVPVSI